MLKKQELDLKERDQINKVRADKYRDVESKLIDQETRINKNRVELATKESELEMKQS